MKIVQTFKFYNNTYALTDEGKILLIEGRYTPSEGPGMVLRSPLALILTEMPIEPGKIAEVKRHREEDIDHE